MEKDGKYIIMVVLVVNNPLSVFLNRKPQTNNLYTSTPLPSSHFYLYTPLL